MKKCRDDGFQIAVAVVDRFGQPQVMLRDRYAGLPARRYRRQQGLYGAELSRRHQRSRQIDPSRARLDAGLARLPHVAMLAGGLMIEAGGTVLGGIGVCRRAGRRQGRGVRQGRAGRHPG